MHYIFRKLCPGLSFLFPKRYSFGSQPSADDKGAGPADSDGG